MLLVSKNIINCNLTDKSLLYSQTKNKRVSNSVVEYSAFNRLAVGSNPT